VALTPGALIGPYEIAAQLGAGGMGEVYRARDTRLKRDVALKILPESFATDPERLARFQREAEVLAALNHPNIAAIFGLEEQGAARALVMELVEGETLTERIARAPIPVDEAIPIARQIADALEAAHDQGIVHRDLKPANIKIRPDGTVKVLDFGLAKALEASGAQRTDVTASPTITSPAMTRIGVILGTAAYMSPEQAKGRPADKRSDVWAFGCVLYEMLTGRRAFDGENVTETLAAVLRGEPDWSALAANIPPPLRALTAGCLEKDRQKRVGDLAAARFVLDQRGSAAPVGMATTFAQRSPWKSVAAIAAAVLLTAALAGTAAWRLKPAASARLIARFSFTLPEGQQLTTVNRHFIAISPDGTQIVYVANGRLFLRSLTEFNAREIAGTEDVVGVSNPTFSPDGRSIAFHARQEGVVKRVALTGGTATAICSTDAGGSPERDLLSMVWDASGIGFSAGSTGIFRCSPSGGAPEQLTAVREGEQAHGFQLLLDGRALLFTIANAADGARRWDTAQIVMQTTATGARQTIIRGGTDARYLPTGHLLYSARGIVFAVPFDPMRQAVTGEPVPVVEGVMRPVGAFTGSVQFAISRTGVLLYVPGPVGATNLDRVLAVADRAGTVTPIPLPPGPYDYVRSSRDGSRLAIGSDDGRDAIVWIYEVAGKNAMRRLTFVGKNHYPVWSPDGRRVAFQSDREGDHGLFVQNADGTGALERLTTAEEGDEHVPESWSPDGRYLLFSVRRSTRFSLQVLSIDDKKAVPFGGVESVTPISAVFSPDGRWVAYVSSEGPSKSSSRGVYIQSFPATDARYQVPKQPGSIDYHPVWAPDGTELFYVPSASSRQLAAVRVSTQPAPTFGNPVNVPATVHADTPGSQMRAYDMLPDGRLVGLIAATEAQSSGARPSSPELRVVLNWFEELKRLVPTP
jgi:eukaryotic-like serine/threonine-protein kinase